MAVPFAVALQEAAGVDVITDGEWRRFSYVAVMVPAPPLVALIPELGSFHTLRRNSMPGHEGPLKQTPLNADWDLAFVDLLVNGRLDEIDEFKIEEISKAAGRSAHEVRTWVAAFSALAACGAYTARLDYYRAINEWIAGYGVVSAEQA